MTSDLFDEVEPPEEGFTSSRPDPVVPAEPRPRRNPHRKYDLVEGSAPPAQNDAEDQQAPFAPASDDEGPDDVDFAPEDFDIDAPTAADPVSAETSSEFAYTNESYGPAHRDAFDDDEDSDGGDVGLDGLLEASEDSVSEDTDGYHGGSRSGLLGLISAASERLSSRRSDRDSADSVGDGPYPDAHDAGSDDDDGEFAEFERVSDEHHRRGRRRRTMKVAALVTASAVVLGAALVGITRAVGPDSTEAQAAPEWATDVPSFEDGGSLDALLSPVETTTIETAGATSWFAAGVAEYDEASGEVSLYDLADGGQLVSVEVEGFEYFVEFSHSGGDVLGIRTAEGLTAINDQGEVEDFEFEGSLTVEGSAPLVIDEETDETHLLDFDEGLVQFSINNDLPVVAADDRSPDDESAVVYQVDSSSAEIVAAPIDEPTEAVSVSPTPVSDSAEFSHFGGLGNGFAAVIWDTDSGAYVGVHDVTTGEAESVLPIDGQGTWEVGRGSLVAVVEDHAVSLATGELVGHDPQMDTALGPYPVTEDRRFFVDGAFYSEDQSVLGGTATTMFVRTPSGDVASYDRQGATS